MAETETFPVAPLDWPAPPLHRKYVRAIHEYQPSHSQGAKTASLRPGDLVLVHLAHGNGWLDGTVLGSGTRGWLPANYCQPYDHERIRNLFHALTSLWNECASTDSSPHQGRDQSGFVAGVRYLLEHNRCLRSDDALVQNNLTVRRTRSNLLAGLSVFVKTQDAFNLKSSADLSEKEALEQKGDLIYKAFRVAVRAVRLLDVCIASAKPPVHIYTAGSQAAASEASQRNHNSTWGGHSLPAPSQALGSERFLQCLLPAAGIAELSADTSSSHPREDITMDSADGRHATETTFLDAVLLPPASAIEWSFPPRRSNDLISASELLSTKHQAFLDAMGSFIALHMQSQPSCELWRIINQSLEACAALLTVLFAVRDETGLKSLAYIGALAALKDHTSALLTAISDSRRANHLTQDSMDLEPAQGRMLINAATTCVLWAGDCVAHARDILDTYGDFTLAADIVVGTPPDWTKSGASGTTNLPSSPVSNQIIVRPLTASQRSKTEPVELLSIPSSPNPSRLTRPDTSSGTVSTPSSYTRNDSLVERLKLKRGRTADSVVLSESAISTGYQDSVPNTAASHESASLTRASTPVLCKPVPDFDQLSTALKLCRIESCTATELKSRPVDQKSHVQTTASHVLRGKDNRVIAGTLPGLIETMTSQTLMPNPTLVKAFLTTYRCFATAVDVATTLIRRYDEADSVDSVSTPAQLRVFKLFKQWLEQYWDQQLDLAALGVIQTFAENHELRIVPASRTKLLELIARARNTSPLTSQIADASAGARRPRHDQAPPPLFDNGHQILLSRQWVSKCTVVDFNALEVARQLTLLDYRLFCAIRTTDLLASISSETGVKATRVSAITHMSTNVTNLVTLSILATHDLRKRTSIVKQWTLIANECLSLQNYDTLMAIMCSLQSSTVVRLKQTWNLVPPRTISLLDYLKDVVNHSRNYASLRQRLAKAKTPCLPFVGLYLTDLTFLDAGNQNYKSIPISGLDKQVKAINFDKWYRAFGILEDFQRFQTPYALRDVPEMQAWLIECLERTRRSDTSLNTLYKQSLFLEPSASGPKSSNSPPLLDSIDLVARIKAPRLLRHGSQLEVFRSKFM